MIPFGNVTITIYNKYQYKLANGKVMTSWQRTVVDGCARVYKAIQTANGIQIADTQLQVQIPYTDNYVTEYMWDSLVNDDRVGKFTAQSGDLIVLMAVDDEVTEFSDIEDIEKKYGSEAFKVTQVNNNFGNGYPLPHIRVVQ